VPHKGFSKFANFEVCDFKTADKRFSFDKMKGHLGLKDTFGELPESVFVHAGKVSHSSDVNIGAIGANAGLYVIDGDLEVGGLLNFTQIDGAAILYVTGSVTAKNISVEQEAQLWIKGSLEVEEYLLGGMSDAGGIVVHGTAKASVLIATDSDVFSFKKKLRARVIEIYEGLLDEDDFPKCESAETALAKPFDSGDFEHGDLIKALKKGKSLVR
jgi:hypothetical protein